MTLQSRPMRRPPPKPAKQMDGYTPKPRTPALRRDDGKARMSVPIPKSPAIRSQALREAYRQLPCQFQWPGMSTICGREDGTVCCCHANWASYGKGMARKADDTAGASGCAECHRELDQGKNYGAEVKRQVWEAAHARSVVLLHDMGLWASVFCTPGGEITIQTSAGGG